MPSDSGQARTFDLRVARMNQGLSIRQLAARTGVSRNAITQLERGGSASEASVKPLADYFGVLVTDITPAREPNGAAA